MGLRWPLENTCALQDIIAKTETMDRLDAMHIFVTVAEQLSFAGAARRHALSAARVTRAVAALESHLDVRLLHRTTRAVRLTEAGASYLVQCKRILAELEQADALARSAQSEPSGQLSITAPRTFGRLHVTGVVNSFLQRYARVSLRVIFTDRVIDFYEQNIDIAIRIGQLPDSGLRAVRVGSVRRVVCASPAYLREHGAPANPRELAEHALIGFSGAAEPQAWSFTVAGQKHSLAVRPRLVVNNADLAVAAAVSDAGLTQVISYQVREELARKRLKLVLTDFELPAVPVHIVHAELKGTSARVRAFVELATTQLRARLAE
jgi:DNA-binding transcriptional LysR family regulator